MVEGEAAVVAVLFADEELDPFAFDKSVLLALVVVAGGILSFSFFVVGVVALAAVLVEGVAVDGVALLLFVGVVVVVEGVAVDEPLIISKETTSRTPEF